MELFEHNDIKILKLHFFKLHFFQIFIIIFFCGGGGGTSGPKPWCKPGLSEKLG
jgi:hypothetical protein